MKITLITYIVDMLMFAKIDAPKPSRSFLVTFCDVHTYTTVCMPYHIALLNCIRTVCKEVGLIKISLQVCLTCAFWCVNMMLPKMEASELHKLCPLYSLLDILAMCIRWLDTLWTSCYGYTIVTDHAADVRFSLLAAMARQWESLTLKMNVKVVEGENWLAKVADQHAYVRKNWHF